MPVPLRGRPRALVSSIVAHRFGSGTRLVRATALGGERARSVTYRVQLTGRGAPASAVVKRLVGQPNDEAGSGNPVELFNAELAALRYLATLDTSGIAPELYGDDAEAHLLVMRDLGDRPSLATLLLGENRAAAVNAFTAYATSLAVMHGASMATVERFRSIRAALGELDDDARWRADLTAVFDAVPGVFAHHGLAVGRELTDELRALQSWLRGTQSWPTLTHGDPCPDNNVVTAQGSVVQFDFEFARVRPAVIDAAYLTVPFPTCWCVNALPSSVRLDAVHAYQTELARWLPEAADRSTFLRALTAGSAFWLLRDLTGLLGQAEKADGDWGPSTWRQRLVYRLPVFTALARQADALPALAEAADALHRRLTGRWVALPPMPVYPSLR